MSKRTQPCRNYNNSLDSVLHAHVRPSRFTPGTFAPRQRLRRFGSIVSTKIFRRWARQDRVVMSLALKSLSQLGTT